MGFVDVTGNMCLTVEPVKDTYYSGDVVNIIFWEDKTTDVFEDYGKSCCYGIGYRVGEPIDEDGSLVNNLSDITWNNYQYVYSTSDNTNKDFEVGRLQLTLPSVDADTKLCLHRSYNYSEDTTPPTTSDPGDSSRRVQAYLIISKPNNAPTISGSNSDLGNKEYSFTVDYTVNDADTSDSLKVTTKLDSIQLSSFTATRNQKYTIDLSAYFDSLSLGSHTITINVTDGKVTATRTYTFTKIQSTNNAPSISGSNGSLGYKKENFTFDYSVNDADTSDSINVTVKLDDNTTISTVTGAERNKTYTVNVDISSLSSGKHTITINATDSKVTVTRKYTFYKVTNTNLTDSEELQEFKTYKLDFRKNRDIYIQCMQLDDIVLNFDIYNDGSIVNAEEYIIELCGGKENNVVTTSENIVASSNHVRVVIPRQLVALSGENVVELKFINALGKQKRTFPICLDVKKSIAENAAATISITKLQKLEELLEDIDGLEEEISKNADNVRDLKEQNDRAEELIPTITEQNDNAKANLPLLIDGNNKAPGNITELTEQNEQATKNIEALSSLGDATDLAQKCETNKQEIEDIKNNGLKNTKAENVSLDAITGMTATDVQAAIQEVFTNASNGKTTIAAAITGKGVTASDSDTFDELANKIGTIETGVKTEDATATAADIRNGKTAYVNKQKITGNIQDMPGSIGGIDSNAFTGSKSMCTKATFNDSVGAFDLKVGPYYLNGSSSFRLHIPNLLPKNIVKGVKVGWEENYIEGTKEAPNIKVVSLTEFTTGSDISVNVDFQPKSCIFIVDEKTGISSQFSGKVISGVQYFKCFSSGDYSATDGFKLTFLSNDLSSTSGTKAVTVDNTTNHSYSNGVFTFTSNTFTYSGYTRTAAETGGKYIVVLLG